MVTVWSATQQQFNTQSATAYGLLDCLQPAPKQQRGRGGKRGGLSRNKSSASALGDAPRRSGRVAAIEATSPALNYADLDDGQFEDDGLAAQQRQLQAGLYAASIAAEAADMEGDGDDAFAVPADISTPGRRGRKRVKVCRTPSRRLPKELLASPGKLAACIVNMLYAR